MKCLVLLTVLFTVACSMEAEHGADSGQFGKGDLAKPADLAPTWDGVSQNIFTPHCVGCHNAVQTDAGIDLSSYDAVVASQGTLFDLINPINSLVIQRILSASNPKPPTNSGFGRLSQDQIAVLLQWIELGIPEE